MVEVTCATRKLRRSHTYQVGGRVFLGGDQVTLDDMGSKISAKLENKTDKEVFFRGDVRANYGKVMDAIDGVRSAGVSQIGLLTEKRDDSGK